MRYEIQSSWRSYNVWMILPMVGIGGNGYGGVKFMFSIMKYVLIINTYKKPITY
jgi:hypothetical protein